MTDSRPILPTRDSLTRDSPTDDSPTRDLLTRDLPTRGSPTPDMFVRDVPTRDLTEPRPKEAVRAGPFATIDPMTTQEAWDLLSEFTKSESLRRHALAVETHERRPTISLPGLFDSYSPYLYACPVPLVVFLLLTLAIFCSAQDRRAPGKNPYQNNPQAAETGRAMFRIYCAPCHGIQARGGRGPDLTRGTYFAGESDSDLYRIIANGVPGTEMPSFSDDMSEETIWRLVTYIRSTTRHDAAAVTGDAAAGEKLFWGKGGCSQCHRVGTKGGHLGPELTREGRQRSLAYLRESIVSPNADLTPGYATVKVVTRDGKTITGVQKGFDNFSAQLMDADENFYSFEKSNVTSIQREFRSLMPDGYGKMFSASEIDDLLAYLTTLRGKP